MPLSENPTPPDPDEQETPDLNRRPQRPPNRLVVAEFHAKVIPGPEGGSILALHDFNENVIRLYDVSDPQGAQILSDELRPSHVEMPEGVSRNGSGVIRP